MRKLFALLCALLLPCFAVAEGAIPSQVQDYYDAFAKKMGATYEIKHTTSLQEYCNGMPSQYYVRAASRVQYDHFYYWLVGNSCVVSVCMIGDRAAAYVLDFNPIEFVGCAMPEWDAINNHTAAYAAWRNALGETGYDGFNGEEIMVQSKLLSFFYNPDSMVEQDFLEFDHACLSVIYSGINRAATFQILPRAAYEGLSVEGEALTLESNHQSSVMMAAYAEMHMLQEYLERNK